MQSVNQAIGRPGVFPAIARIGERMGVEQGRPEEIGTNEPRTLE